MKTSVTFKSDRFRPFLPEDAQVNPECYGAELAWWLCRQLADRKIFTSYPNYEDWGWFLEYIVGENEYWLCCGNDEGAANRWRVFLRPMSKGLFARKKAPLDEAAPLLRGLQEVLAAHAEISEIEWTEEA